jgi:hypothetical protein
MRGTTLSEMVQKFRLETGQSMQLAQGQQTREHVKQMLDRVQEVLYNDFDWPFLRIYRTENILVNERLYSWPDDLVVEDVRQLWDKYNDYYTPVGYGITFEDRNAQGDTDLADPILKWQIVDDRQYEVWPTPASARTLYIYGYKAYSPLKADGDRCILDDNMIILFAAAEWLARNKMADANAKLQAAQRVRQRLQGKLVSDKRRNVISLVGGLSPNAVYLDPPRRVYGLPPPIPR